MMLLLIVLSMTSPVELDAEIVAAEENGQLTAKRDCWRYRCDSNGCGCRPFQSNWCGEPDRCGNKNQGPLVPEVV